MPKKIARRRRNPTGTLLVNSGRKGKKSRKSRRSRNPGVSLSSLFVQNPKKRTVKRRRPAARRASSRRRNPVVLQNPISIQNPHRRRGSVKRHRGSVKRRRNPSHALGLSKAPGRAMFQKYIGKVQGLARRLPLAGGVLAAALGVAGSVLGGAVGVLPATYAMPYVAKYVPSWLKPYGYSVAGMVISGVLSAIPLRIPYKEQLVIGVAAAGGAVDMYRFRNGRSMDLGDEYGSLLSDDEYSGDEYGDDEMGDDGSAFASVEFADANLGDAEFCGDDFSDDEIGAIELGRRNFRRRFLRPGRKGGKGGQEESGEQEGQEAGAGNSEHAGLPGRRWGWLIFWIGHENAKLLAQKPEGARREFIAKAKHEAKLRARKLLTSGLPSTMQAAETAGLLVAA
jgi:hypothetical protein